MLSQPSGTLKYAYRGSRLVILPDYQNLGIGSKIAEYIGEYYLSQGYKFFDRSSHLRLRNHWENSPLYLPTSSCGKVSNKQGRTSTLTKCFGARDRELNRIAYSFEYMGQDYVNKPHIYIRVEDNPNINYDILKEDLIYLHQKYYLCVITGKINETNEIEKICLELGIRTQLLYTTKNKISTINNAYKNKQIIKIWDEKFSQRIRKYYK